MKTAKEVLTKYSDGDYTQFQGYENILMAMEEYAKEYHESRMKEELIGYLKWFYGSHFDALDELKVNAYLATRKNK